MVRLDNPILNSPFEGPSRYWSLDDAGKPTGEVVEGRRRSEYIVPIATSKRKSGGQEKMIFADVEGMASTRANDIVIAPFDMEKALEQDIDIIMFQISAGKRCCRFRSEGHAQLECGRARNLGKNGCRSPRCREMRTPIRNAWSSMA
jgi:hypothetical protein